MKNDYDKKVMDEINRYYDKRKYDIRQRLAEFKHNNDLFYELCFCILTPQSNAKKCYEAVNIIKKKDFIKKDFDTKSILHARTRFYKNKSKYLKLAKNNFDEIKKNMNADGFKTREHLAKNVKGLGYKEASHYLRNMGYKDLAILDRHILRNLHRLDVIKEMPRTLTKNKYIEIENEFKKFSNKIKIPMDELDLLFWSLETGEVFR